MRARRTIELVLLSLPAAALIAAPATVQAADDDDDDDLGDDDDDDDDDSGDPVGDDLPEAGDPWGLDTSDDPMDVGDSSSDDDASSDDALIVKYPHAGKRDNIFEVHGGFTYWGVGFGGGARYTLWIVKNGFIKNLNNSFGLSFGLDLFANPPGLFYDQSWGMSFLVPVTATWAFYLTEEWTVFAEAGLALWFRPIGRRRLGGGVGLGRTFDPFFVTGLGGMWHFSKSMALIIRLTFPYATVGVTLPILK